MKPAQEIGASLVILGFSLQSNTEKENGRLSIFQRGTQRVLLIEEGDLFSVLEVVGTINAGTVEGSNCLALRKELNLRFHDHVKAFCKKSGKVVTLRSGEPCPRCEIIPALSESGTLSH